MRTTIFINKNKELNYDTDYFKLYTSGVNCNIVIDKMANRKPRFLKYTDLIVKYNKVYNIDDVIQNREVN